MTTGGPLRRAANTPLINSLADYHIGLKATVEGVVVAVLNSERLGSWDNTAEFDQFTVLLQPTPDFGRNYRPGVRVLTFLVQPVHLGLIV